MVIDMNQATPLRIQFSTACQMLDVTRESLRHTIRKDPTFPKPMKMGTTKQAPVFFDYQEIVEWHNSKKEAAAAQMEA
ncbi:transcriptional regulator [Acinetobacter soli]|nr:transcriptional regulator [Acinetobacter soli]